MLHACLYTICFVFCYTLWCFYAFSRTNLLRDDTVPVPCFCYFCVSENLHRKYSQNWMKQKQKFLYSQSITESKAEMKGSQRVAAPCHGAGHPWPRRAMVWAPGPLPNAVLPPIYSPRREHLKAPINFPQNLLQATAIIDARSGGSRSSSRHPVGEGNHRRRPSSSPCLPSEWCVSSLPWPTGP
jgi:hypothetical protein